jgi:hypothetical protein
MPRMDVGSAIAPAFQHMAKVLFRPFDMRKWLALGFVSIFAGAGGGSGNFRLPGNYDHGGGGGNPLPGFERWIEHYWPILVIGILFLIALGFVVMWLISVFHFVYLNDVARNSGAIREPFHRLRGLGTSLFLWNLVYGFIFLLLLGVLVAAPLLTVFVIARDIGTAAQVAAVIWAVLVGISMILFACVVEVVVSGFVSTAMYVKSVGILEGWRIVLPILRANVGQLILYILLLIAFGIGIGIASVIVALITMLIFAIPFGGIALVGYLIGKALHLTLSVPVIAVISTYTLAVMLIYAYAVNCLLQPAVVFLRAFSLVVIGQADPSLTTISGAVAPPATAAE